MIFVMHIVGARPNFMKADPVIRAMEKDGGFRQMLVHTGQHYDDNMSKVFFDDLGIRKPDVNLDVRQTKGDCFSPASPEASLSRHSSVGATAEAPEITLLRQGYEGQAEKSNQRCDADLAEAASTGRVADEEDATAKQPGCFNYEKPESIPKLRVEEDGLHENGDGDLSHARSPDLECPSTQSQQQRDGDTCLSPKGEIQGRACHPRGGEKGIESFNYEKPEKHEKGNGLDPSPIGLCGLWRTGIESFFRDFRVFRSGKRSLTCLASEAANLTTQQLNNSTTRTRQIAAIERAFEPVLLSEKPDWVFVYGDVNSTIACARVAAKHGVKIAHVEAGLRSFDMTMPEEVNRIETDQLADLLFVTEESGLENLKREAKTGTSGRWQVASGREQGELRDCGNAGFATTKNPKGTKGEAGLTSSFRSQVSSFPRKRPQIHFVGNTMIDTVARLLPEAAPERVAKLLSCHVARDISRSLNSTSEQLKNLTTYPPYALVTLHRPGNVDDPETLARIMEQLEEVAKDMPVLFPVHPRTAQLLKQLGAEGIEHSAEGEIRGLWSTAVPRTELRSGTGVYGSPATLRSFWYGLQSEPSGLYLLPPQGYLDFLALQANAAVVITDSGGIQEETSYLGVPCLTVRPNTERPVTIEKGTNRLCKVDELHQLVQSCIKFKVPGIKTSPCTLDMAPFTARSRPAIPLWDGHAAERIVEVMKGAGGACETHPSPLSPKATEGTAIDHRP